MRREFYFALIIVLIFVFSAVAQQQSWSTIAIGTSLPGSIPRSGYMFFRTSDSTVHISTGVTWRQVGPTAGGGGGITLAQARAGTGWTTTTSGGIIAKDTVARRIEWGGIGAQQITVKIFDTDGDTINFSPNAGFMFSITEAGTRLFGIDSGGTPTSSDAGAGGENFGHGSVTTDGGTAIGFSATSNSGLNATAIGYQATATGTGSIALGMSTTASASGSIAIGHSAQATSADIAVIKATNLYLGDAGTGESSSTPTAANLRGTSGTGTNVPGGKLQFLNGTSTGDASTSAIDFYTGIAGASGTAEQNFARRINIENDGDVAFGPSPPVSGSYTFKSKPTYFTYEGTPAGTDSSLEIDVEGTSVVIRGFSGNGSNSNIAWHNGDSLNFAEATGGYVFKGGNVRLGLDALIENNGLSAGEGEFAVNAETDTVSVFAASASDLYFVTFTSALAATVTSVWVERQSAAFVVHLEGTSTGQPTYMWKREKP